MYFYSFKLIIQQKYHSSSRGEHSSTQYKWGSIKGQWRGYTSSSTLFFELANQFLRPKNICRFFFGFGELQSSIIASMFWISFSLFASSCILSQNRASTWSGGTSESHRKSKFDRKYFTNETRSSLFIFDFKIKSRTNLDLFKLY